MRKMWIIWAVLFMSLFQMSGCRGNVNDSIDFIKGADISSLQAIEDGGGKFYDLNGKEKDCIKILKKNGVNYLRLRIFNDPVKSFDGGDYCDLEHTVIMAKRIKKAKMGFLLDFHYSDWWADGGKQNPPEAWKDMTTDEVEQAVYDYTRKVLGRLKDEKAYPDMVQIGNEIGNGMLWDHAVYPHYDVLARFINSGIRAVRETQPEGSNVKIAIHHQDGGAVEKCEWFFSLLEKEGVSDYDIIGLSYYPYWHGTFAELRENMANLHAKLKKEVVVLETAYPYTNNNGDGLKNMVNKEEVAFIGLPPSVENQRLAVKTVINAVACSPGGKGVFYWEPVWIPIKGVGVGKGEGNAWENQAMFYFGGTAIPSITVFDEEVSCPVDPENIAVYPQEKITVFVGGSKEDLLAKLPEKLPVLASDGTIRDKKAEWDLSKIPDKFSRLKEYLIPGKAAGIPTSTLCIVSHNNYLKNPGFEEGDRFWTVEKSGQGGTMRNDKDSTPKSGEWSFHFWDPAAFEIVLSQVVTIDNDGDYVFETFSQGVFGSKLVMDLFIESTSGLSKEISFTNNGWRDWQNPRITGLNLKKGEVVSCGVRIHGTSKDWGTLDDFCLYNQNEE